MRDPARIDRVVELLKVYWKRHPDQRLGQLVYNLGEECGWSDNFNLEDDQLEAHLRAVLKKSLKS